MRKLFIASGLFAICSIVASAQFKDSSDYSLLYDSETASSLRSHVSFLSSAGLEGRKVGSEGEKQAAEYVYNALKEAGVDMLADADNGIFGICPEGKDTLVSRNVYGFIQGYDPDMKDRYIVIGARLDNLGTGTLTVDGQNMETIYYGANGNASGLAMMIELARKVSTNSVLFRRSVLFVGFGASTLSFAGSWHFLNRSFAADVSKIDVMLDLDMLGIDNKSAFYAYTCSNADVNALLREFSAGLHPIKPEITAMEPYPSDNMAFYDKKIPSVLFTTGRYPEHNTTKDTESIISYEQMEKELEFIYNATLGFANTSRTISFTPDVVMPDTRKKNDVISYYDCDTKPSFLGNSDPRYFLSNWVYQYLKYPQEAVEKGIQGTVQVTFTIDKEGNLVDAEVTKGIHPLLDEEALRIVNGSPRWKPGRVRGEKVKSSMTLSIEFRLESSNKKRKVSFNGLSK